MVPYLLRHCWARAERCACTKQVPDGARQRESGLLPSEMVARLGLVVPMLPVVASEIPHLPVLREAIVGALCGGRVGITIQTAPRDQLLLHH